MMKRCFLLLTLFAGLCLATIAHKVKALGIAAHTGMVVTTRDLSTNKVDKTWPSGNIWRIEDSSFDRAQASYLPAEAVTGPVIAGIDVDITAYGASTSGTAANNAIAIGKAVTAAAAVGAGLYVPIGTFPTNSVPITVPVQFAPGASILQPATRQTITFTKALTIDTSKHFDNALAGQGTISFTGNYSMSALYPQWWGAKGDGTTETGPSIVAAVSAAVTAQAPVLFPSGTYAYSTCPNFGFDGLVVQALGKVVLKHTGTGHALKIVEPGAAGIYNLEILGNLIVEGNARTHAEGVLIESVHHSKIQLNGNGAPATMFTVKWAVLTEFDLIVSVNDSPFSVTPTTGVVIRESAGGYTSASRFNLTIEGVSGIGIDVQYASGCTFTGTSESNGTGLRDNALCLRNTYNNVWFEGNKVTDAALYGKDSVFINVHSQSLVSENFDLFTAQNTKFIGGMLRKLNLQAGSADTLLLGVATSDHPALGIVGVGTQRRIGCIKLNTSYVKSGSYPDIP
jgi:hypothetical protein